MHLLNVSVLQALWWALEIEDHYNLLAFLRSYV